MEVYVLVIQLMRDMRPEEIPVNDCVTAVREWSRNAQAWAARSGIRTHLIHACYRADSPVLLRVRR